MTLAGLLYVGAGVGLAAAGIFRRKDAEAPLQWSDLPILGGAILFGGILGPVLLVVGLARLSGVTASLLLNLEAPFTIALASSHCASACPDARPSERPPSSSGRPP
jgi:drug/metabolite transporter (DMT)-like permease